MGIPVTSGMKFLVAHRYTYSGKNYQTSYWYSAVSVTGTVDSDTASTNLMTALNTTLFASLAAFLSSSITIVNATCQVVAPTRVRILTYTPTAVVGTGPATTTSNVSAAITKHGALSGRKYTASTHIPAPDDSTTMIGGVFTVAAKALLTTIAGNITSVVPTTGVGFQPVINNGLTISEVTFIDGAFAQPNVRVMRRRTVGQKVTRRKKVRP